MDTMRTAEFRYLCTRHKTAETLWHNMRFISRSCMKMIMFLVSAMWRCVVLFVTALKLLGFWSTHYEHHLSNIILWYTSCGSLTPVNLLWDLDFAYNAPFNFDYWSIDLHRHSVAIHDYHCHLCASSSSGSESIATPNHIGVSCNGSCVAYVT